MARTPTSTRADVEGCYPDRVVGADFIPTHRVIVVESRKPKCVVRRDFVTLQQPDNGVCYALGPFTDAPLYAVLSTGLWQCLDTHGRANAIEVRYDADYIAPKDRKGVVYFVEAGCGGPIKIGWSQDTNRRIAELQTANAHRLSLLGTVPGTMETEAAMHARFSHLRLEAEWFENSAEIHEFLRESAVTIL